MTLSLADAARLTAGATMWTTGAVPEQNARSLMLADGPMGVAVAGSTSATSRS